MEYVMPFLLLLFIEHDYFIKYQLNCYKNTRKVLKNNGFQKKYLFIRLITVYDLQECTDVVLNNISHEPQA